MIKKTGDKYTVYSESGKRMSKPSSKKKASKRLRQVEFFKRVKKAFGDEVGVQDVSAAKKTLEVETEKPQLANKVEIDAYKSFLKKAADDPSYTVETRDGIADHDRHLIALKQQMEDSKKGKYGTWLESKKS